MSTADKMEKRLTARGLARALLLAGALSGLALAGPIGCGDDDDNPAGPVARGELSQGKVAYAAVVDGNFEVHVLPAGGAPTNLTRNEALDQRPVWSPDGSQIAFVSDRGGDLQIFRMEADGSGVAQLTDLAGSDGPVWSPDGSRIAFVADSDGGNIDLYVVGADGTGQQRLTTAAGVDQRPVWSPDGGQLAFVSNRDSDSEIYIVNADGTGQRRLTNNVDHDDWPSWSADGAWIAFESNRGGISEIYRMTAAGADVTRLSDSSREVEPGVFVARSARRPVWAPQGEQIVLVGTRDDDGGELYLLDGSAESAQQPTRLSFNNGVETDYQWSPDGSQILYVGFSEGGEGSLFAVDADGGAEPVRLLDGTAAKPSWR